MRTLRNCILSSALLLATTAGARDITGLAINGASATIDLTAGTAGDGHVLYYAWSNDGEDKGASLAAWPNVVRLGRVADGATSHSFALPAPTSVTTRYAARAFLATSDRDYDNLIEGVKTAAAATSVYFETGVNPSPTTSIAVDAKFAAKTAQQYLFGVAPASGKSFNTVLSFAAYINGSSQWASALKDKEGDWQSTGTTADTSRNLFSLDAATGKFSVSRNGSVVAQSTHNTSRTISSSFSIVLFGRRTPSSASASAVNSGQGGSVTIYSCSITNNGTCVRNYLPAVKDGVAGLYDTVNNAFAGSATAVALVAVGGTNLTYAIDSGDAAVAVSPVWPTTRTTPPDYVTGVTVTDAGDRTSATGGSKSGAAPLVLSGANDWGGTFSVNEGALIADFGQGLAATDNLVFNGGTYGLLTGSTFNWTIGGGDGETSIGAGATEYGFTAYTHPFAVVAGGDATTPFEFGTASATDFNPARFILNDDFATDTVTFKNGITGNNGDSSKPTLEIYSGAADAVIEGTLLNVNLVKRGAGTLSLRSANNSLGSIYPYGGTLVIAPPEGSPSCTLAMSAVRNLTSDGGSIVISNAVVTQGGENMTWYGGTKVSLVGCTVTSSSEWYPGNRPGSVAKGTLVLDGTTINANNNTFAPGYQTSASCDVVITNAVALTFGGFEGRNGTVRQYGGSVTIGANKADVLMLGVNGGTFAYHLYGGSLFQKNSGSSADVHIGRSGNGGTGRVYVHDGATFTARGSDVFIGTAKDTTGELYVQGGTMVMETRTDSILHVGRNGYGTCEISGNGVVNIKNGQIRVSSGTESTRTGTLRVTNGGTAKTRAIVGPANNAVTATLVLDGGTVVANASASADFIHGFTAASVGIGGAAIDSNGQDLEVSQNFAARAGQSAPAAATAAELAALPAFTKAGAGRLALTGTNDWLCATCVSNGTLAVEELALPATTTLRLGGGVIDLCGGTHTVANLVGSGVVSNGTLVVTGTVWPGVGDAGILKIDATASLTLSAIGCAVAPDGTCGCLVVDGMIDLSGVAVVGENMEDKKEGKGLTIARATQISGRPATTMVGGLRVSTSQDSLTIGVSGTIILLQ